MNGKRRKHFLQKETEDNEERPEIRGFRLPEHPGHEKHKNSQKWRSEPRINSRDWKLCVLCALSWRELLPFPAVISFGGAKSTFGIPQVQGSEQRQDAAATFFQCLEPFRVFHVVRG
jgi:hypothetical protein